MKQIMGRGEDRGERKEEEEKDRDRENERREHLFHRMFSHSTDEILALLAK